MIRNKLEAFGSRNQHVRLMTSSELDKCLREALFSNNVGCPDSILFDISQATYHDAFFDRIMKSAWRCVSSRAAQIRRIQKGVNLLTYLAVNGSERCIVDIQGHMDVLQSVTKLKFAESNKQMGQLVSEKASQLISLILDPKSLQDKRKYSASIRDRFVSVASNNGMVETEVLHKPVFILEKSKNINNSPRVNSFNGFGGFANVHQQNVKPGRRLLSKLFKSNLKISNRPQNIGLYGNNLNKVTRTSGGFSSSFGNFSNNNSYSDEVNNSYDDNTFNAFPTLNNTNDSYYKHSFSKIEPKGASYRKTSEDSSFKYNTSSTPSSDSSYTESEESSYSSTGESIVSRDKGYRKRYESDSKNHRTGKYTRAKGNKYSSTSSTSSVSSRDSRSSSSSSRNYRQSHNYGKSGRKHYTSSYKSTTSSYASSPADFRRHETPYHYQFDRSPDFHPYNHPRGRPEHTTRTSYTSYAPPRNGHRPVNPFTAR